jgi:cytidylate kinase
MSQPSDLLEYPPPRHGFRGAAGQAHHTEAPLGLAVAVSREAGARGGTIGRLAGKRLGWQVYDQDLLEFMAQDAVARQGLLDNLTPACSEWVDKRMEELRRLYNLGDDSMVLQMSRLVLALAAGGEVVLIGRGANFVLPRETTLNVRVIAPLRERIAYMGQWLRLPVEEATEKVRSRDERRREFLLTHFRRSPDDVQHYDLVLNTGHLGEEVCAELVATAARMRVGPQGESP